MGQIAGWVTADYLHQHARRQRHTESIPDRAWQALIDHHDPRDTLEIADNARWRGHTSHAVALCKTTADGHISRELAELLREHGYFDELRRHADAGHKDATFHLVNHLNERGRSTSYGNAPMLATSTPPGS